MSKSSYPKLETELPRLLMKTWKSRLMMGGSGWMGFEGAKVYIRVGPRVIKVLDEVRVCVTIANITVPVSKQGVFTRVIGAIRRITYWTIYLEGVLEHEFANKLIESYGWKDTLNHHSMQQDLYYEK